MSKDKFKRNELEEIVKYLKSLSHERAQYIKAKTRLTNQMKAIARRLLNKPQGKPVSDKELSTLIEGAIAEETTLEGIVPLSWGRDSIDANLKSVELSMKKAVRELPIWTGWAENISGVGEITIANIIGGSVCEAETDLIGRKYEKKFTTIGDYSNPAKLWKRWGVGVVDGARQRRIKAKIDEKKKYRETKEFSGEQLKAIQHGYSPARRAQLWNLGEVFVKRGKYYRRRYDQEKARQLQLHPEVFEDAWGNKKAKNYAQARAHNRAMRYVTKLFLVDFWNKWREMHGEGEFHELSSKRD